MLIGRNNFDLCEPKVIIVNVINVVGNRTKRLIGASVQKSLLKMYSFGEKKKTIFYDI